MIQTHVSCEWKRFNRFFLPDWHTCFVCRRSACRHCYTCTKAVCPRCLPTADFLQVKGKNGFCSHCLKLALILEENKDYDSDGEPVDFKDRETYEGLFKEYYLIIKENEGFELHNIYAAKDREKAKKNYESGIGSLELDEDGDDECEEDISEYDGSDHENTRKRKPKFAKKNHKKPNKKEFIGWGSRTLIEFLESIGTSTSEALSQRDVTDILNGYILENKLLHLKKRKMVVCDERLQSLFRKRMISKYRIYDLLEDHFTENHDESEENSTVFDSEKTKEWACLVYKRQRKFDMKIQTLKKNEREYSVPQSFFASISVDNVKLVYLKRSLLFELLKHPESFEEKVIGCFVRVKSDPYDYRAKYSHQLMQVKGIKSVFNGESNTEVVLCFSAFPKEVHINLLSDDDFSEEECADLRKKTLAGLLVKPTLVELQQKAIVLHEDLTKHWINKELALLQKLIDRTNEKGQRRKLSEYLEKRKRLQTPSEQARLLESSPIVSPEISDLSPNLEDRIDDEKNDDNIQPVSTVPRDRWEENEVPGTGCRDHWYFPETKQPLLTRSGLGESHRICIPDHEFKPAINEKRDGFETCRSGEKSRMPFEGTLYEQMGRKNQDASTFKKFDISEGEKPCCILGLNEENDKNSVSSISTEKTNSKKASREVPESTPICVIELLSDNEMASDLKANNLFPVNQKIDIPKGVVRKGPDENSSDYKANLIPVNQKDDILKGEKIWCINGANVEKDNNLVSVMCTEETQSKKGARKGQSSTSVGVIELLDDDENDKLENSSIRTICSEETQYDPAIIKSREHTQIEVIELLDDDESGNESRASSVPNDQNFNNLESKIWCFRGPNGEQEKWSMFMLKRWSEISPCAFKFKVWKEEQKEENAIWLGDAINFAFSKK